MVTGKGQSKSGLKPEPASEDDPWVAGALTELGGPQANTRPPRAKEMAVAVRNQGSAVVERV